MDLLLIRLPLLAFSVLLISACSRSPHSAANNINISQNSGSTLQSIGTQCNAHDSFDKAVLFADTLIEEDPTWTKETICNIAANEVAYSYKTAVDGLERICSSTTETISQFGSIDAAISRTREPLEAHPNNRSLVTAINVLSMCHPDNRRVTLSSLGRTGIYSVGRFTWNQQSCYGYLREYSADGKSTKIFELKGINGCSSYKMSSTYKPNQYHQNEKKIGDLLNELKYTGSIPDSETVDGITYTTTTENNPSKFPAASVTISDPIENSSTSEGLTDSLSHVATTVPANESQAQLGESRAPESMPRQINTTTDEISAYAKERQLLTQEAGELQQLAIDIVNALKDSPNCIQFASDVDFISRQATAATAFRRSSLRSIYRNALNAECIKPE